MGLFGNKKPENENITSTQNTPADQHIINEVESVAKTEGAGGGTVERLSSNSEELRKLLNEFKAMQGEPVEHNDFENHSDDSISTTEEYSDEHHSVEEGEKYTLSAEENNKIEKYLVGEDDEVEAEEYLPVEESEESDFIEVSDDDDVIYIDEMADDGEVEEEYSEEEPIEDVEEIVGEEYYDESDNDLIEEEYSTDDIHEEVVEEYVDEAPSEEYVEEYVDGDSEEEIVHEEIYEDDLYVDEPSVDEQEYIEDEVVEDVEEYYDEEVQGYEADVDDEEEVVEEVEDTEEVVDDEGYDEIIVDDYDEDVSNRVVDETNASTISEEDIDKKLDAKLSVFEEQLLSKLMATMNMANQNNSVQTSSNVNSAPMSVDENIEAEDLHFEGQVVIFEPIEKIKQATWEDVVRRKGHYTYHVTASSNGGWFIKRAKSPNPYAYLENKQDAMNLAIVYAKREKAELKVHNEKGVIETSMSFGREKKIN